MSQLLNGKCQDLQKPFPGCMGRMINIFDLSAGMVGTKLLTDKENRDGSPVQRNRFDLVKKPVDPVGIHVDDRPMANEPRKSSSIKRSGGAPMKMLIAQEMSDETESKRKPPSIVARLMGLDDTLPVQRQPILTAKRSLQEGYPRSKSAGALRGRRQEEDAYIDRPRSREIHSCSHEKEYKDVYEVWQQPIRNNHARDASPLKGRCNENQNEKRLALVRQKFMEAKRLATDEKLLQSKVFQDAIEVLSSNRDLFLKFLEEPNSLFSKDIKQLRMFPSPPQTERITVLKPSKTIEQKAEKHMRKQQSPVSCGNERTIDRPSQDFNFSHPKAENLSKTTRIVVLKPSPAKTQDVKTMATTPISSPELSQLGDFYGGFETGETMGSREIAKEITRHMRETVSSHRRDDSFLSSVLSNGYVGDDSSFEKSENEYVEEDVGNLSDSEVMTPTTRNSWDYNNRFSSPYSVSSSSRTSYSPESSVIREAKKRLSERWALVASNGTSQEQMQLRRSSSTLGEMLAIRGLKKEQESNGVFAVSSSRSCGVEEELRAPAACLSIGRTENGDGGESSSRTLPRSKSVPVSSSTFDNISLNLESSESQINKSIIPKEGAKAKSSKSSFKGKVSSFFSRNKRLGKQKTIPSPLVGADEKIQSSSTESVLKNSDDFSKSIHDCGHEESPHKNYEEEYSKVSSSTTSGNDGLKKDACTFKVAISLEKPRVSENLNRNQSKLRTSENSSGNQDQPSPTSVLDGPFEDDVHNNVSPSSEIVNAGHLEALSRSAPIESIARSLSWDDVETSLPNSLKCSRADEEEKEQEHEQFMFVQDLLSSSNLNNERVNTVFARWHSAASPLDPMLLFKILDHKEEGAKSRVRRSSQRLMFDCVNAALLDIGQAVLLNAHPWAKARVEARQDAPADALVKAEVWSLVRDWFYCERNLVSCETDNSSLVVERLLRKEVAGRVWDELMRMETAEVCKEIGGKVLDDLVGEALLDFTGECS